MSEKIVFILDGEVIEGKAGQTVLEAAENSGKYIPRLCAHKDLEPYGGCRVCTVKVNGRPQAACTQPISDGINVESETEELNQLRKEIIEMLFVEGNHFCMYCEKSGDCELQALAYRFGIVAPQYPYQFPQREVDASHPDILLDRHRCILCSRCVRASRDIDGKNIFQFVGRGPDRRIAVNSEALLADTDIDIADKAVDVCPVGAILRKRVGYSVPVGQRAYDKQPIGTDVETLKK